MTGTLLDVFVQRAHDEPAREALRELAAGGAAEERTLTWGDWEAASRALAATFVADGVPAGARVAVLAGNSLLWPVADLGIQMAGLVSVGIYPTSSAAQVEELLADCDASAVIVDGFTQLAKLAPATLAGRTVIGARVPAADDAVEPWEARLARGRELLDDAAVRAAVERRLAGVRPDDDAALVYTSGSTGEPKGARLSHRYVLASAESIRASLGLTDADSSLAFLPFSHAAERIFGLACRIRSGMCAGIVVDHSRVWDAARAFEPTLFGGVPRFFEKLHEAWGAAQAAGMPADEWRRAWLGGRLRLATSGGAAFPRAIGEALDAAGVRVLGAYGLTEHLCVAFNRPDDHAFDTVGPPMPGTELRIGDGGEVLVRRGALTFSGYFGRPDATAEAFTPDGAWLRTGDLGTLDAHGRLRITGRAKELIALAAGKKVAPVPLETRLVADEIIGQAVCLGEGRRFVTALLSLRRDAVERWARARGIDGRFDVLLAHELVRARVQRAVDAVNETVSPPERIRRFHLLDRELSVEAGELTPTLKVRRAVVAERFAEQVEALYQ